MSSKRPRAEARSPTKGYFVAGVGHEGYYQPVPNYTYSRLISYDGGRVEDLPCSTASINHMHSFITLLYAIIVCILLYILSDPDRDHLGLRNTWNRSGKEMKRQTCCSPHQKQRSRDRATSCRQILTDKSSAVQQQARCSFNHDLNRRIRKISSLDISVLICFHPCIISPN